MRQVGLPTEAHVRSRLSAPGSCQVELVPDGPALVRGAAAVRDSDGTEHPVVRPVVALCTCGLSQRAPWCDATHKSAPSPDQVDGIQGPLTPD